MIDWLILFRHGSEFWDMDNIGCRNPVSITSSWQKLEWLFLGHRFFFLDLFDIDIWCREYIFRGESSMKTVIL